MGRRLALKCLRLGLGCAAVLLCQPCGAAEWAFEPSVQTSAEYDSNYALTPAPHPNVWSITVSPDIKFSGETETLKVVGGLNYWYSWYFGQGGLDTSNYDLSVRSTYKPERNEFGFRLDAIRDTTLITELATTGAVLARVPRNQFTASPSWTRALTETTSVITTYAYTNVRYSDTAGTSLTDFQDQSVSVALQSIIDPRKTVSVTAYYDYYATDPGSFKANTYGVQGGITYAFSETLRSHAIVGARFSDSTIASQTPVCDGPIIVGICFGTISVLTSVSKERSTGYTLDAGLEKLTQTDRVSGRVSREIYPSGLGSLIQTDRIQLAWSKQWTELLSTAVDASVYHTRYVGGSVTDSNSRYYTVEPRLTWRLSERWLMNLGYRYARQSYDTNGISASGSAVYLNVSYAWQRIAVSR